MSAERFWLKVKKVEDPMACWPWMGANDGKRGYGRLRFKGKRVPAHRIAYRLSNGQIPEGLGVLHHCDNPTCCRPDHLYAGSPKQNSTDMVSRGRSLIGRKNHKAKLTELEVEEIRRLHADGFGVHRISKRFQMARSGIRAIVLGKHWKSVPLPELVSRKMQPRPRGEENHHARLTTDKVLDIRRRRAAKSASLNELARQYGVSKAAICHIVARRSWAYLADRTERPIMEPGSSAQDGLR